MILEMKNVVKRYGDLIALDHFNLEVHEGEILGLLGPNGSGKSTSINCMLALLKINQGEIKIFNEKMTPSSNEIKKHIGVVMQNVAVLNELTVYENIDYFCGLYISDSKIRKQYVEEAIDFVQLQEFRNFLPKKLSGGLLRRLNIACGIAHKPKLIFMDEPTVAVDPQSRNNILEGVKRLNAQGATIIYTSHYMEEIEFLCDRIVIMDQGKQIAQGTKRQLTELISIGEKIVLELADDMFNIELLQEQPQVLEVDLKGTTLTIHCQKGQNNLISILQYLEKQKIEFNSIYSEEPTLNDVFLEITGKALRDHNV